MSEISTCSGASLAAGEALAATATEGADWLLIEMRGAWGRDAIVESGLPVPVREWLEAFPGKPLLIRRPGRRRGVTVMRATVDEGEGTAARHELDALEELPGVDLEHGDRVSGPVVLVCAHGRRDACCARLGPPLFDALGTELEPDRLWQSSHLGGHRFAPNVLVLPHGVQLGRIPVGRAREVIALLAAGRIPLDLYRGRTIYPRPVQAAEIAIRTATGCDGVADLRLVSHEGDRVVFSTPGGELVARVAERPGPVIPVSCGAEPEPTASWAASLDPPLTEFSGTTGRNGSRMRSSRQ